MAAGWTVQALIDERTSQTIDNPFGTGEAFMGLELARGSLSDVEAGRIEYPRAFYERLE